MDPQNDFDLLNVEIDAGHALCAAWLAQRQVDFQRPNRATRISMLVQPTGTEPLPQPSRFIRPRRGLRDTVAKKTTQTNTISIRASTEPDIAAPVRSFTGQDDLDATQTQFSAFEVGS